MTRLDDGRYYAELEDQTASLAEAVRGAGLRGTGESLHFHATDTAGEWLVRRTPSAVEWEPGHGRADVAVRGRAVDLALLLNRRGRPAVEVIGDDLLLAHWLENGAFA